MPGAEDAVSGVGDAFSGVSGLLDPLDVTGQRAGKAAKDAARVQTQAGREARAAEEAGLAVLREDLDPFRAAGVGGLDQFQLGTESLQSAISDPTAGVIDNPFFRALSADQDRRLLAVRAAGGKTFSGGTNDALIRQQLQLGNQFSQQNIGNIQSQIQNSLNLSTLGQNAAARTGTAALQSAGNVGGILGNVGNVNAAGIIGANNAQTQGASNAIGTGLGLFAAFSDQRLKENIEFSHVHPNISVNIYTWDWTEEAKQLVGDQEAVGPIAQELQLTRPDLVITDPDTGFLKVVM